MCIIKDNYIMYGSWNMERDKQIFFSFLVAFLLFYPTNNGKIKILKKMKKKPSGDIIILHKGAKNHDHILQCSPDTIHGRCNFYFSFWAIFLLFKRERHLEVSSFYICVWKVMITWYNCSWDMVHDGQTTEKVTYRGGCYF